MLINDYITDKKIRKLLSWFARKYTFFNYYRCILVYTIYTTHHKYYIYYVYPKLQFHRDGIFRFLYLNELCYLARSPRNLINSANIKKLNDCISSGRFTHSACPN